MDFVGRLLYFHGGFCLRTGERWLPGTPASTIAEGLVQGGPRGRSLGIYRGISWEIYWIIVDIYIYIVVIGIVYIYFIDIGYIEFLLWNRMWNILW